MPMPNTSRYDRIMKQFGKKLRHAREAAGYTSAEKFARDLSKEPHTYRHYERGEAEPDYETLERICRLLRVTPNDLLPFNLNDDHASVAKAS